MRREELRKLTRDELLARAEALGVSRPAVLTQSELVDEIVRRTGSGEHGVRGWLGRARDLVAQVVSKGLHLPEAARLFRGEPPEPLPLPPPPLPTVTLAEIYAAQGHVAKAIAVLDQVLDREPAHPVAPGLRASWTEKLAGEAPRPGGGAVAGVEIPGAVPGERDSRVDFLAAVPPAAHVESHDALGSEHQDVHSNLSSDGPAPDARESAAAAQASQPSQPRVGCESLVFFVLEPTVALVSWEVRPLRAARAQSNRPDGHLALRVTSFVARDARVASRTSDVRVDALSGALYLPHVEPQSHVRACLGWKSSEGFAPMLVGTTVTPNEREGFALSGPASQLLSERGRGEPVPLAALGRDAAIRRGVLPGATAPRA